MNDTRIADYDIVMRDEIRRLFADIYPDQPEIVDRMCYDPTMPSHVTTKVAYRGESLVGQANIFFHKALNGNANLGFHVHPLMRRQGIATALSGEAIKDARSKGITVLYIRTPEDNFPAIAVAHSLGFTCDDSRFAEKGLAVFMKQL
ncbi:MAG TPA: GNAT family N-acetyltransferase [Thermodesulfobacteriota bacterium]|jgi:RimJ/RimL family protein N-acetyltransferase|nr:GNAT family N-acetyltransferase [Thermodesulfobacteriota bacterium]